MIINVAPCVLGESDRTTATPIWLKWCLPSRRKRSLAPSRDSEHESDARAEAGDSYINTGISGGNCIYTNGLLFNSSNGNFTLNNCGIYDNGNLQTNSGDSVTASTFLYYGSWSPNNCNSSCTWNIGGTNTGTAVAHDHRAKRPVGIV